MYSQEFRNATTEGLNLPSRYQYSILLRINGVLDEDHIATISNHLDCIPVEMTDIVLLDVGDVVAAREGIDYVGGDTLQKSSASVSVTLLHCLQPADC